MFDIKGKVAIVTGGASGIGKATAKALLEKGAYVVVSDVNKQMLAETSGELANHFPMMVTQKFCDVSDEQQVKELVQYAVDVFGHLDIMVNNAGVCPPNGFLQYTQQEIELMVGVNQNGVVYGCKHAIEQMLKQGTGGAIVNTSSMMCILGNPNAPYYSLTKGAVRGLSKALAMEFAKDGIRVNSVYPGYVHSGLVCEEAIGKEAVEYMSMITPLGRLGTEEELAHAFIFAIENTFLTGAELIVDGGFTSQ